MLLCSVALVFLASISTVRCDSATAKSIDWTGWGGNIYNNRWASTDTQLSSSNIKTLTPQCKIAGPVSATPVNNGNIVYYPTWSGLFIALDYQKCKILWQLNVTDLIVKFAPLTPLQGIAVVAVSRTSPQIDGNVLYFGTQAHALMVAVDRSSGKVLSTIQLNSHPLAIITQSPTFYDGKLFVGVSSNEEATTTVPGYVCCSFVGNMMALTFDHSSTTFSIAWNIPMIPPSQVAAGWSGVAVWGSQPSIDESRGQVFIGTGNSYTVPQEIIDCQAETANITAVAKGLVGDPCLPDNIWQESVIAIDIKLGIVNWVHQLPALDAWTLACGIPGLRPGIPGSCPQTPGPDSDFGMAPAYVPGSKNTPYGKDVLVIGQKNGNLYAMSAQAGTVFWSVATSPGSVGGGLSWGVAVDDSRVYFTAINALGRPFTLQPSGQPWNHSAYGAASLKDGSLLWEVPSPDQGVSTGLPTVVGDLVLVPRSGDGLFAGNGSLVALKRDTGSLVKTWGVQGIMKGGVAVNEGTVMFGTGYGGAFSSGNNGSFYALAVGGS